MRSSLFRMFIAVSLMAALAIPAGAEIQLRSQAFRVNQTNDFKQQNPTAAFSPAGNALVVWENDQMGIRGAFQRLNGIAASAQLTLVANETLGDRPEGVVRTRKEPSVAFLSNGQFLLAWTEERAYLRSAPFIEQRNVEDQDIFIQRFAASGAAIGAPQRVNSSASGFQSVPKLAVLAGGGAVVVWKSTAQTATPRGGLAARLVDAKGQPIGAEIAVSDDPTADHPAIAAGRKGFVVVWDGVVDGAAEVFARLYEGSKPVGSAFKVNPTPAGWQRWPAVAAGADGNFLVAWQSWITDRSVVRIHGQMVSPAGSFLGASFLISRNEGPAKLAPALAATNTGFLATWLDWSGLSWGINAVELDAVGDRVGAEFWVAPSRVFKNYRTAIAADGAGGFLVPWETTASRKKEIFARGLGQ